MTFASCLLGGLSILCVLQCPPVVRAAPLRGVQFQDSTIRHYEYVLTDGWIYVYDIDNDNSLVKSVAVPTSSGVRGAAVCPADGMMYISYGGIGGSSGNGSLLQFDLLNDSVRWNQHYTHGIDNHSIALDGKTIFMPNGSMSSDGRCYIVRTTDGAEIGQIATPSRGIHNTLLSLDGSDLYMGDRDINNLGNDSIYVARSSDYHLIKSLGLMQSGVRPFTINGTETFLFVNVTGLLGFQVVNLATGLVEYTVDLTTMGFPKTTCGSLCPSAPSHGISLSPDESELYVLDQPNGFVHVFDISHIFSEAPQKVADIHLVHDLYGNDSACAQSCQREGWLHHTRDGHFVYVGDAGDVINTATRSVVGYLPPLRNTRKMLEIDWQNGVPVFTTSRNGLGYVTTAAAPPVPVLPPNGEPNQPDTVTCVWRSVSDASSYRLQLASDSSFASPLLDDSTLSDTSMLVPSLSLMSTYFWRIRADWHGLKTSWSPVYSFTVNISPHWMLVSLSRRVADGRGSTLFPRALSRPFGYDPPQGYVIQDTLRPGSGYWVRFGPDPLPMTGDSILADTIPVHAGWNLIGSISVPIPVTSVSSVSPGLRISNFFGYNGRYVVAPTIRPGAAYWAKMSGDGVVVLSGNSSAADPDALFSPSETPPPPPLPGFSESPKIPRNFALHECFPNPFNPSTTLRYELPFESRVSVTIYNPLGQLIEVLSDRVEDAGYKEITWTARNAPSGVYVCKLTAAGIHDNVGFSSVRKLLLVR